MTPCRKLNFSLLSYLTPILQNLSKLEWIWSQARLHGFIHGENPVPYRTAYVQWKNAFISIHTIPFWYVANLNSIISEIDMWKFSCRKKPRRHHLPSLIWEKYVWKAIKSRVIRRSQEIVPKCRCVPWRLRRDQSKTKPSPTRLVFWFYLLRYSEFISTCTWNIFPADQETFCPPYLHRRKLWGVFFLIDHAQRKRTNCADVASSAHEQGRPGRFHGHFDFTSEIIIANVPKVCWPAFVFTPCDEGKLSVFRWDYNDKPAIEWVPKHKNASEKHLNSILKSTWSRCLDLSHWSM